MADWRTASITSLSKTERDMVDLVCANFDNVVLVYNGANTLELGFVDEHPRSRALSALPGTGSDRLQRPRAIVGL